MENKKAKNHYGRRVDTAKKVVMSANNAVLDDPYHVLLNEKQAADFLGFTDRALQQRRYLSLPPAYIKLPGSSAIRYRLSVLLDFVEQGEVPLP